MSRIAVCLLLCFPLLASCSSSSNSNPETKASSSPTGKKIVLAVIPKGTTHEFWKSVHAGAQQAADELAKSDGLQIEIVWKGPLLENDREGQIDVMQNFITQKVAGICLAPLDAQGLVKSVKDAKELGIPTVIFDSGLDDESVIVSYVATDNYKGGVMAAEELGKRLGGKGGVVLLRYNQGSESTHQREQGFLETLAKKFPDIKILSADQYSGTTPETSLNVCQQLFQKFGKEMNGCFAVAEPNGTGMLQALEDLGLAGKTTFITFDPSPGLIASMKAGKCHGIVLQDPLRMGYLAVKTMVAHLQGKQVDKRIDTGEYLATPENMDSAEMKPLLSPKQL